MVIREYNIWLTRVYFCLKRCQMYHQFWEKRDIWINILVPKKLKRSFLLQSMKITYDVSPLYLCTSHCFLAIFKDLKRPTKRQFIIIIRRTNAKSFIWWLYGGEMYNDLRYISWIAISHIKYMFVKKLKTRVTKNISMSHSTLNIPKLLKQILFMFN